MLWDLPTRLFHWLLALSIFGSWLTHELERPDIHQWFGYFTLSLLLFRLAWGVWGSEPSLFRTFLRGPATVFAYLRGDHAHYIGHSPLGGWAVIILLGLTAIQAVTGLFMTDEILFDGPLYRFVSDDTAAMLGGIHGANFYVLLAAVAVHVSTIAFYRLVRKQDLLFPMITGKGDWDGIPRQDRVALVLFLVACLIVYLGITEIPKWF